MPQYFSKFGFFSPYGDVKDTKKLYTEPKVDPFDAKRFEQIWIFFQYKETVRKQKYCILNQNFTHFDVPRF